MRCLTYQLRTMPTMRVKAPFGLLASVALTLAVPVNTALGRLLDAAIGNQVDTTLNVPVKAVLDQLIGASFNVLIVAGRASCCVPRYGTRSPGPPTITCGAASGALAAYASTLLAKVVLVGSPAVGPAPWHGAWHP